MKRILIVAVIMAMLMSGCSVMMSTMEQGATQPTVEEMLAQALQLSNAGNYEEAILLYEAIIEIEPNNYEAGYGLGHAYRSVGRTTDAISILKKAAKLSVGDKRAMYELGYAYLDAGEYSNARRGKDGKDGRRYGAGGCDTAGAELFRRGRLLSGCIPFR